MLDGWATTHGIDLTDLRMHRFENVVWWYMIRDIEDPVELDKVTARLWRPPVGVAPKTGPWSAEAETASFAAFKSQVTGRIGGT